MRLVLAPDIISKRRNKTRSCQCSMASAINMRQVTQNDAIFNVKSDMLLYQYELIIMIYYYYTTRSIWYCMTVYEEPRGTGWACSISCQISFSASSGSPESAIKKLRHSIEWSLYAIEQPAILAKELFHHPLPPWGVKLVLAEEMKNATAAISGIAVTPSSNFNSSGSLHALQLPTKSSSCRRGLSGLLPPSSPIPMILCKELRLKIKQKTQEDCRFFGWTAAAIFPGKLPLFWKGTSQFSFLPLAPPRLPIHVGGFKLFNPTQPVSSSMYRWFSGSPWQPAWPLHFCSRPAGIHSNTCLAFSDNCSIGRWDVVHNSGKFAEMNAKCWHSVYVCKSYTVTMHFSTVYASVSVEIINTSHFLPVGWVQVSPMEVYLHSFIGS